MDAGIGHGWRIGVAGLTGGVTHVDGVEEGEGRGIDKDIRIYSVGSR